MEELFTLWIRMGNDAMQDGGDVAGGLEDVGHALRSGSTSGRVRDTNGNTVGEWECDAQPQYQRAELLACLTGSGADAYQRIAELIGADDAEIDAARG
jgi:hypothetical protein